MNYHKLLHCLCFRREPTNKSNKFLGRELRIYLIHPCPDNLKLRIQSLKINNSDGFLQFEGTDRSSPSQFYRLLVHLLLQDNLDHIHPIYRLYDGLS